MAIRVVAKIIIVLLSIYCVSVVVGYFYNVSITFPFLISDGHHVPEYRLQSIRLSLLTTFVYFSIRFFCRLSQTLPRPSYGNNTIQLNDSSSICFLL